MTLNLRARFLILVGVIFVLGGAAGYRFFVWYSDEIVTAFGHRFAERNALYEKGKILGIVTREVTLAQKMASSPVLKEWVAAETDPKARRQAISELEDFRRFFRNRSYFFALAKSGNYYYNDDKGGQPLELPRYTLSNSIRKDGWFYATLADTRDIKLNVDTDRHLGVTRVWINTVVRDQQNRPVAVTGSGLDLSDFIRSVVSSRTDGATNVLIDEVAAIQAHQDVSMIDFASVRKAVTKENQSTFFDLLDRPDDIAALKRAMGELVAGRSEVTTLELKVQGQRQLTGIAWVPEIRWFILTMANPGAVASASAIPAAAVAIIASLILILLAAAVIIERTVIRRLSRLDRAALALSERNYAVDLADDSADEIGRLTRTFGGMAERVASYAGDLEQQVKERTTALEAMAHTDFLTGCLNRRGMVLRLEMEMNRLARQEQKIGLLIVDVDLFKRINDTWGHAIGDRALVAVAEILRNNIRAYDACARWGGEEFLIGMFGLAHADELEAVAQKLLTAIRTATLDCEGATLTLTYSIGGIFADSTNNLDAIIKQVDDALYRAKSEGRDRAVIVRAG